MPSCHRSCLTTGLSKGMCYPGHQLVLVTNCLWAILPVVWVPVPPQLEVLPSGSPPHAECNNCLALVTSLAAISRRVSHQPANRLFATISGSYSHPLWSRSQISDQVHLATDTSMPDTCFLGDDRARPISGLWALHFCQPGGFQDKRQIRSKISYENIPGNGSSKPVVSHTNIGRIITHPMYI